MRGLSRIVKELLSKAKESSLLAVEIYNKPVVTFKSGSYIVLMVIAWTSLFHAYFFKNRIKPYHKDKSGKRFLKVSEDLPDGTVIKNYKWWELTECIRQYFKDKDYAVKKNLEFFIPLRNKIEHRNLPELDINIYGECQALITNFNNFIENEFGEKHSLKEILSFSLQFLPSEKNLMTFAPEQLSKMKLSEVVDYIKNFRSSLTQDIFDSPNYSFKAVLIKVVNHEGRNALPIKFINYNELSEEDIRKINEIGVVITKEKYIPVINKDILKATNVVDEVKKIINKPFNTNWHANCWKKYNVRSVKNDPNPEKTNSKYCIYDTLHKDYAYTKEWVNFLIQKLSDEKEYESIKNYLKSSKAGKGQRIRTPN